MPFKPLFWPTIFAVPALIILLGLGTWQLQRLQFKNELLAQINENIDLPAVSLPLPDTWQNLTRKNWNYKPVFVEGEFNHAQEFHVFSHISDSKGRFQEAGYLVITPLKLKGSDQNVLISRGFVPEKLKQKSLRKTSLIVGAVKIEGLLRFSVKPNAFTPAPDLQKNIWFGRDVSLMASRLAGQRMAPFFIELKTSDPKTQLPIPRAEKPKITNNHLSYAITWYGIALGLIVIYVAFHRRASPGKKS